jgi:tetratricopeptide (TPR) repeat protein
VLGQLERAVRCCQTALRLRPDYPEAANNLGLTLLAQGDVEAAVAQFREALGPGVAMVHNNLANALRLRGDKDQAAAHFRQALEIDPGLAEAHSNLGQFLLAEARACYAEAVRLNPNLARVHNYMGQALQEEGDLDEAERIRPGAGLLPRGAAPRPRPCGCLHPLGVGGCFDEAAEHLRRANALCLAGWRKRGQGYDPADHTQFVDGLIASSRSVLRLRCLNFQASLAVLATRQARPSSAQRSCTQPASRQASMTTTAGRECSRSLRRRERSMVKDSNVAASGPA